MPKRYELEGGLSYEVHFQNLCEEMKQAGPWEDLFVPTSLDVFNQIPDPMEARGEVIARWRQLQEEQILKEFPQQGTERVEHEDAPELTRRRFGLDVLTLMLLLRYELFDSDTKALASALEAQSAADSNLPDVSGILGDIHDQL